MHEAERDRGDLRCDDEEADVECHTDPDPFPAPQWPVGRAGNGGARGSAAQRCGSEAQRRH